jgi:hypothetical protein
MPRSRPALGIATLAVTVPLLLLAGRAAGKPDAPKADQPQGKALFDGRTLTNWAAADFADPGKVQVKDGAIVMEAGATMTGATYTGKDFPRTDYEVTFEGKKIDGDDFFCTATFPVGEDYCSLVVGGWGGTVVGLSSLNFMDASENETTTTKEFKHGQWYRVRVRVRPAEIQAWIDDEKLVDIDTTDRRISIRIECQACRPFGFATWKTTGAVRNVRVRPLTDAEKKAKAPGEKK